MSDFYREQHKLRLAYMPWLYPRLKPRHRDWAVPWQADFYKCTKYGGQSGYVPAWWPSARPNEVLDANLAPQKWDRTINSHRDMVDRWWELGVVIEDERGIHEEP